MDWVFRLVTIILTVAFAALVSGGVSALVFQSLSGAGFMQLPLAAVPLTIGLYASIHVVVSCLTDDRG